jgi:hypothetical protein
MRLEKRLIALVGSKNATLIWEKIKHWHHDRQYDFVEDLKKKLNK